MISSVLADWRRASGMILGAYWKGITIEDWIFLHGPNTPPNFLEYSWSILYGWETNFLHWAITHLNLLFSITWFIPDNAGLCSYFFWFFFIVSTAKLLITLWTVCLIYKACFLLRTLKPPYLIYRVIDLILQQTAMTLLPCLEYWENSWIYKI